MVKKWFLIQVIPFPKIESLLLLFHLKFISVSGAALYNSQDLGFTLQFW